MITIEKISDREISINGKQVLKNMSENWEAKAHLEQKEISTFQRYINILEKILPGSVVKIKCNH